EFRKSYGAMVNAQMKLRQAVQGQVEQAAAQLNMPTRTEVDAAHRKIAELERVVRRMERGPGTGDQGPGKKRGPGTGDRGPAKKQAAAKKKPVAKKGAKR